MNFKAIRKRAGWLSQFTGAVVLVISVYMQRKFVFESGNTGGMLLLISMIATLLTFIFGLLSLPRWQGFVALAITAYAVYWMSGSTYAVS